MMVNLIIWFIMWFMFSLVLVGTFNKLKECFNSFNFVQKPNSKNKTKKNLLTLFLISPLCQYNILLALPSIILLLPSFSLLYLDVKFFTTEINQTKNTHISSQFNCFILKQIFLRLQYIHLSCFKSDHLTLPLSPNRCAATLAVPTLTILPLFIYKPVTVFLVPLTYQALWTHLHRRSLHDEPSSDRVQPASKQASLELSDLTPS